jgi:hypothetical protein
MSKFRDPTALLQFVGALLGVLVAFNLGLTDEQASLWLAAISALFTAVNAVMVRPITPAAITGLVSAVATLIAGYGFEIGAERVSAINFAVTMALALFFARPNVTPVSDPQPGQGVTTAVASRIRGGSPVV